MTKVLIDVKNAQLENAVGFKGSKGLKDTYTAVARVNADDVTMITIKEDDPAKRQAISNYFQNQINTFTTKSGETVSQLQLTITRDDVKGATDIAKTMNQPLQIIDQNKNELQYSNNIDKTGVARLVVVFGHNDDYDTDFSRVNAVIIKDPSAIVEHATSGVNDDDLNF